jgi:4-coumarate--CoA ligase
VGEDGMVTITDRIKEMIKVKGIGVAPAELEDLLLGHGKVEDVAVLGVRDEYSGERPKAFVVLKGRTKGDDQVGREILRYVKERKVRHKWVKEVEFVEVIPKSASGKILRRLLRDRAKEGKSGMVVRDEESAKAKL